MKKLLKLINLYIYCKTHIVALLTGRIYSDNVANTIQLIFWVLLYRALITAMFISWVGSTHLDIGLCKHWTALLFSSTSVANSCSDECSYSCNWRDVSSRYFVATKCRDFCTRQVFARSVAPSCSYIAVFSERRYFMRSFVEILTQSYYCSGSII